MSEFSLKKIFKDKRAMGLDVAMLVLVLLFSLCSIVTCVTLLRYDRDDAENESIQEKSQLQMVGENFVEYVRMHADEAYETTITDAQKATVKTKFGGNFMPSASAYDIPATFKTAINQVKSLSFYALTENGAKDVLNVTNASCDKGLVLRYNFSVRESETQTYNELTSLKTYVPIEKFSYYPAAIDLTQDATVSESGTIKLVGYYITDCPVTVIGTRVSGEAISWDGDGKNFTQITDIAGEAMLKEVVENNFKNFSIVGTGIDFTKENVDKLYFYRFTVEKEYSGLFDYEVVALCGSQYITLWSVSKGICEQGLALRDSMLIYNNEIDSLKTYKYIEDGDEYYPATIDLTENTSVLETGTITLKGYYISKCEVSKIYTRVSNKNLSDDGVELKKIEDYKTLLIDGTGFDFENDNAENFYFYEFTVTKTFSGNFDYEVVALCGSQYVSLWHVNKGTPAEGDSTVVFDKITKNQDFDDYTNYHGVLDHVYVGSTKNDIKNKCKVINSNSKVYVELADYAKKNLENLFCNNTDCLNIGISGWFIFADDAEIFGNGVITDYGYSINSTSISDIIQSGSFNVNPYVSANYNEPEEMRKAFEVNTQKSTTADPRRFNITAPILQGNNTYYFYVRTGNGIWYCFYTITNTDYTQKIDDANTIHYGDATQYGCVDWVTYGSDETIYSSGHTDNNNLENGKATWTIDATDLKDSSFEVRGWYGYVGLDGIKAFGYSVDDGYINYKSAIIKDTGLDVKEAIVRHYGPETDEVDYYRFWIYVPYSGGCHTIHIYVNILGMDVEIFRYNLTDKRAVLKEGTYREYGEVTDVSLTDVSRTVDEDGKTKITTKITDLSLVNYSTLDFASFTTGAENESITLTASGYYANYYNVNSFGYCFEYEDTYYEITAGIDLDENYEYKIELETYNDETVKTLKIYEKDTKEIKLVVSVSTTTLDVVRWYCEKGVIES